MMAKPLASSRWDLSRVSTSYLESAKMTLPCSAHLHVVYACEWLHGKTCLHSNLGTYLHWDVSRTSTRCLESAKMTFDVLAHEVRQSNPFAPGVGIATG